MKIGVVGTFIRDKIHTWRGETAESIGGIFFTVSYLANLLDDDAQIYPVCFVGEDLYDQLAEEISAYPNVRLDGFNKLRRMNTQVTLTYMAPQERDEVTTEPMPSLAAEQLRVVEHVDALAVNLITGVDVRLEALETYRRRSEALLYLDFHSHALGIDDAGKRYYHRPDDWEAWTALPDVLQLNEMEARTLIGTASASEDELVAFGRQVLSGRSRVCNITLGERGVCLLYERVGGEVAVKNIPGLKVPEVVDVIGCGDAFAAGFLVHYLRHHDSVEAARFANRVAGLNCTFVGSSGVRNITKMLQWQI